MQSIAWPDEIDVVNCQLADNGDRESDYGQIDEELTEKIMWDQLRKWAVALNEGEGDDIRKQEEDVEQDVEQEEEETEEEEHWKMELEEYIWWTRHMRTNDV